MEHPQGLQTMGKLGLGGEPGFLPVPAQATSALGTQVTSSPCASDSPSVS